MTLPEPLTSRIAVAIRNHDVNELYEIKDICDMLHSTGMSYKGYDPQALPSDSVYTQMENTLKSYSKSTELLMDETVSGSHRESSSASAISSNSHYTRNGKKFEVGTKFVKQPTNISDLWMGSVVKLPNVVPIESAIVMPKFDGCSAGVRFKRVAESFVIDEAVTRGQEVGTENRRTSIRSKFEMLAEPLIHLLESSVYTFHDYENGVDVSVQTIDSITVRGEIVLRDKTAAQVPASYVAGKINGGDDVWNAAVDNMVFMPFEITRIVYNHVSFVPQQREVLDFYAELLPPYIEVDTSASNITIDTLVGYYKHYLNSILNPIDGIVYCSSSWTYPQNKSQTTDTQYGKYAWKPSSEMCSTLTGVEYTIARDGKIGLMLTFSDTQINGKTYKRAKCSISSICEELSGIAIGDAIVVKLCQDIAPKVESFVHNEECEPYHIPRTCPFCDSPLDYKVVKHRSRTGESKPSTHTLTCVNRSCDGRMVMMYENLFKVLGIKGVAEKKILKLDPINIENIDRSYNLDFVNVCGKTSATQFLVSLGVGSKTAAEKLINAYNASLKHNRDHIPLDMQVNMCLQKIVDMLTSSDNDPFIVEVLTYLYTQRSTRRR